MIITNCPRCGSMNATTTCTKCGWSQFTKSTVSTCVSKTIGEIELKVSGKALLDDYKRLLFENNSLTARNAELEEENETLKTACDILRGDNNLLFKRLMSIETPDDLQTLKIVYVKEGSEVQE